MKKWMASCLFAVLFISTAYAQYRTERSGYEGDYFSLEGALDLFKRSSTMEDFERRLNSEENWVNNLDLNYDGRIDYIRVEHLREGRNFHAIVLQAVLDRYEAQDVAVIEIEITGRRRAVLQIVGDEDLYGERVIVEPVVGYADNSYRYRPDYDRYVNVFYWDVVQQIICPRYRVYVSPYRWDYYPVWWNPWGPWSWHVFHPRVVIYVNHYHVVHIHRVVRVHNYYWNHRSYSYNVVRYTNEVRVRHGKPPVHRPKPDRQVVRERTDYRSRKDFEQRPEPGTQVQNPAVSPKSSFPTEEKRNSRRTTESGNDINRSETPRSTDPGDKPVVKSRKTAPATGEGTSRRTTGSDNRTETRKSTDPVERPSGNSRKPDSSAEQGKDKSNFPEGRMKESRSQANQPQTSSRSNAADRDSKTNPASRSKSNTAGSSGVHKQPENSSERSGSGVTQKVQTRQPATSGKSTTPDSKPEVSRKPAAKDTRQKSRGGG